MTAEEYSAFENQLREHGYRKWNGRISNEDFYWCKGFEYYEDEYGERECSYQILFQIWDNHNYAQIPDNSKFGVQSVVLISDNHRTDLLLSRSLYYIPDIEIKAKSFYEWAKKNLDL